MRLFSRLGDAVLFPDFGMSASPVMRINGDRGTSRQTQELGSDIPWNHVSARYSHNTRPMERFPQWVGLQEVTEVVKSF
jgi:hypothetical protein